MGFGTEAVVILLAQLADFFHGLHGRDLLSAVIKDGRETGLAAGLGVEAVVVFLEQLAELFDGLHSENLLSESGDG